MFLCARCGEPIRNVPAAVGIRPDVPITLAPDDGPVCAYCLVSHSQPEDEDIVGLKAIRELLGIPPDVRAYAGYYQGHEIHRRLRGWRVETWSVPVSAVSPHLHHPWARRLPRTTGPGVVIRYRVWKPGSRAHVVLWWDPHSREVRADPKELDRARRSEWDEIGDFVERLRSNRPTGRPRGSGTFSSAEEFEAALTAVVEELLRQGQKPTQARVAQHLSTPRSIGADQPEELSDRQLRAWCTRFGLSFVDLVGRVRDSADRG